MAVFSEADRGAKHVALADEAFCIGPPPARESYLRQDRILEVRTVILRNANNLPQVSPWEGRLRQDCIAPPGPWCIPLKCTSPWWLLWAAEPRQHSAWPRAKL